MGCFSLFYSMYYREELKKTENNVEKALQVKYFFLDKNTEKFVRISFYLQKIYLSSCRFFIFWIYTPLYFFGVVGKIGHVLIKTIGIYHDFYTVSIKQGYLFSKSSVIKLLRLINSLISWGLGKGYEEARRWRQGRIAANAATKFPGIWITDMASFTTVWWNLVYFIVRCCVV